MVPSFFALWAVHRMPDPEIPGDGGSVYARGVPARVELVCDADL